MSNTDNDIFVLDQSMVLTNTFGGYHSLVWRERYDDEGEFQLEISTNITTGIFKGCYLTIASSDYIMVVTGIEEESDTEGDRRYIITGKDASSILRLRYLESVLTVSGGLQDLVLSLLDNNVISPTNPARVWPGWAFEESTDPGVTTPTIDDQYSVQSVYSVIRLMCLSAGLGFRIRLDGSRQFIFELYKGQDRSYSQTTNTYVVFSKNYDNVIDSSYFESIDLHRNVTVVVTNDDVESLKTIVVFDGVEPSGINRRESSTDASDIQRSTGPDTPALSDVEFENIAVQRGIKDLSGKKVIHIFDGTVDLHATFNYEEDFFLGDVVEHTYGSYSAPARLIEITHSMTTDSYNVFAAFDFDYT